MLHVLMVNIQSLLSSMSTVGHPGSRSRDFFKMGVVVFKFIYKVTRSFDISINKGSRHVFNPFTLIAF